MNTRKGFTLVELLVVIAILAILATVSVVGYTSFIDRADQSNADVEANQIKTIVTSGLMGADDCVKLSDSIYVTKNADGEYVLHASEPEDADKIFDATDDVTALLATGDNKALAISDGKLVYTYDTGVTSTIDITYAE